MATHGYGVCIAHRKFSEAESPIKTGQWTTHPTNKPHSPTSQMVEIFSVMRRIEDHSVEQPATIASSVSCARTFGRLNNKLGSAQFSKNRFSRSLDFFDTKYDSAAHRVHSQPMLDQIEATGHSLLGVDRVKSQNLLCRLSFLSQYSIPLRNFLDRESPRSGPASRADTPDDSSLDSKDYIARPCESHFKVQRGRAPFLAPIRGRRERAPSRGPRCRFGSEHSARACS